MPARILQFVTGRGEASNCPETVGPSRVLAHVSPRSTDASGANRDRLSVAEMMSSAQAEPISRFACDIRAVSPCLRKDEGKIKILLRQGYGGLSSAKSVQLFEAD